MRRPVTIIVLLLVLIAIGGGGIYYLVARTASDAGRQALDQALTRLPPGWSAHYAGFEIEPVRRAVALKGFAIEGPEAVTASIEELELDDADFSAGDEFNAADPAKLSPDQALTLAARVAAKGVKIHARTLDLAIGAFEVAQPRLYLGALKRPEVLDYANVVKNAMAATQAAVPQAGATLPPPLDPAAFLPAIRLLGAAGLGFGYGPFSIDDVSETITVPSPSQMPAQQTVTNRINHSGGQGYDRGVVLDAVTDGYEMESGSLFHITFGHTDSLGIDARDALQRMMNADRLDAGLLDGIKVTGFELHDMVVQTGKEPAMPVARISFGDLEFGHGVPVSGRFSVAGFKITRAMAALNPQAAEQFDNFHLDALTIGFGVSYRWNVEARTLAVSGVQLKVDELGQLDIAADLSGIAPDVSTAATAALTHAMVTYKDASFADRALDEAAVQSHSDRETLRKQLGVQIDAMAGALIDAASVKALGDFWAKPQTLTVEVEPPAPVPLATLQTLQTVPPAQLAKTLGVSVSAGP